MASNAAQDSHVSSLVQEINESVKDLTSDDAFKNGEARVKVQEAARKLASTLESPPEAIFRHAFETSQWLCTRLGITLRLFHLLSESDKSAAELASISGAEKEFIVRIMRVLNSIGYVREVDEEKYSATALTRAMTAPPLEAAVKHNYDYGWTILAQMPEYFKSHGYKSPVDPTDGPFQYAFKTKTNFWNYIKDHPEDAGTFNTFMRASRTGRSSWLNWFPVQECVIDGSKIEGISDVLLVDVGGGYGHDLLDFCSKFPNARGRLILQDLPHTIAEAAKSDLGNKIETMEHNFFTPQPVKGARIYFFHFVFHDWADVDALRILRNIADAMTPGYSKLILNEALLPEKDWSLMHAVGDIHIMALLSASKRSEKQFQGLLDFVGLKVIKFWYPPDFGEGVIEIMRFS